MSILSARCRHKVGTVKAAEQICDYYRLDMLGLVVLLSEGRGFESQPLQCESALQWSVMVLSNVLIYSDVKKMLTFEHFY